MVTTPAVRDAARAHLGCGTLAGAELEDSGGISSAGSHWESRVFGPELMAASIGAAQNSPALSSLTLALFEDSGWYRPDYAAAEPLAWGRGAGCAFVESACIDKASGAILPEGSSLFCTTAAEAGCTSDRKRRGACARLQYASAITPASQRYFDDAAAGGPAFFDYCPVFAGSSGAAASCADDSATTYALEWGSAHGDASLCFTSTLLNTSYVVVGSAHHAAPPPPRMRRHAAAPRRDRRLARRRVPARRRCRRRHRRLRRRARLPSGRRGGARRAPPTAPATASAAPPASARAMRAGAAPRATCDRAPAAARATASATAPPASARAPAATPARHATSTRTAPPAPTRTARAAALATSTARRATRAASTS